MSQRIPYLLPATLNVFAVATSTYYVRSRLNYNLEEQEARLDEIEGIPSFNTRDKASGTTFSKVLLTLCYHLQVLCAATLV
jgi:hypothetical protein